MLVLFLDPLLSRLRMGQWYTQTESNIIATQWHSQTRAHPGVSVQKTVEHRTFVAMINSLNLTVRTCGV